MYLVMIRASFSGCCMICLKCSNKSQNMKAVIILTHSWSPFFLLIYMEKMNFYRTVCILLGYFTNSTTFKRTHYKWDTFTKLSLSNIMKRGECDVEWQISIQSIHLSAFGFMFGKEKEALSCITHRSFFKIVLNCYSHGEWVILYGV